MIMGNQKRQACVDLAVSQIGYKEGKDNENKYAKYFDTPKKDGGAWQFFNTKKQHADWCSIFVHWVLCHVLGIEETRKALGEPSAKNNCGAGVKYLYNYMKAKGLIIDVKDAQPADVIFLNTVKTCSHVGMVEYVDSKIHTVEGNKSNKVGRGTYAKNSKSIYAIGRIDWSKFPDDVKPDPTPAPAPTPAPEPKPINKLQPAKSYSKSYSGTWKVNTNGDTLNMRYGAGKEYGIITSIPDGKHVTCYGYYTKKDGIDWLCVVYGNQTGYCCKKYLKKI
jgi:hypothetical protein